MSLTVIPDVSLPRVRLQTSASAAAAWFEIRQQDLSVWNNVLLDTPTSLYQFPFWNEPYRPLWLTPRYLAWGTPENPRAFVSILTIGFGPAKIGLVFRGPNCIHSRCALCHIAITELVKLGPSTATMMSASSR